MAKVVESETHNLIPHKTGLSEDAAGPATAWARYNRQRDRFYLAVLLFVVVAGLPMVAAPPLRQRLQVRAVALHQAWAGEPVPPAPALARAGENTGPLPKEYARPEVPPPFLPKAGAGLPKSPYIIRIGEGAPTPQSNATGNRPLLSRPGAPPIKVADRTTPPAGAQPPGQEAAAGEPQFRKGPAEQEAYDFLVESNKTLSGMIQGGDPALTFKDWSAAAMENDAYYVMVEFVQKADNVARKYIWKVQVSRKQIVPMSAHAMSISK